MDFDLFDDFDDAPKKSVRVGPKFQPNAKPRRPKKSTPLVPQNVVTSQQAEKQSNVVTSKQAEKQSNPDVQNTFGVGKPSEEDGVSTCRTDSIVDSGPKIDVFNTEKSQDPGPNVDVLNTGKNEDSQTLFQRSGREDGDDVMIDLESLDILNESSSVFDDIFPSSETPAASNVPSDPVIQSVDDSGLHIPNVEVTEDPLIENEFIVVEPVHNQQDTITMDDTIPDLDAETPEEHIQTGSKAPRKLASRRAKSATKDGKTGASDQSSNLHEGSTPSQTSTRGRVRKKRQNDDSSFRLVDEPEDDALVDERVGSDSEVQPTNKSPGEKKKQVRKRKKDNKKADEPEDDALVDSRVGSDSEVQPTNQSPVKKKRQCRKRKEDNKKTDEPEDDPLVDTRVGSDSEVQPTNQSPSEKKKPGRKRKEDNKKTDETGKGKKKKDEAAIKAPKKFKRSTKRRVVDKSLLENPDDIDVKKVSLTNLIRFAEYKERAAKKNEAATASLAPPPNQAIDNHSSGNNGFQEYDEGDGFGFGFDEGEGFGFGFDEDGDGDGDVHGDPFTNAGEKAFNYQTHMKKSARTKWTERDTELFYEGVQQFGTDFTMIQQLFPERTRKQVKLKYKNEERKYPLRIREAVMNRSQGHSHFDTVIERLKQNAAEEKENDDENDAEEGDAEEGGVDESEPRKEEEAATSAQVDHGQDVMNKEEAAEVQATEATVTEQADDSDDEFKLSDYMCT